MWRATGGPGGGSQCWLVRPNGGASADTINRAEGAAIFEVVVRILEDDENAVIFTDSAWAIHMLRRAVWEPHTVVGTLHGQLLWQAARFMVSRANNGVATSILKVKAHTGIQGNEEADKAAKRAAQPDAVHDLVTPPSCPFAGAWGVAFPTAPLEQEDTPVPRMLPNCGKALASRVHACCKTGHSRMGEYATRTAEMYQGKEGDRALQQESNVYWNKVNTRVMRVVMKHRLGVWWHKGKAFKRRAHYRGVVPTDGLCPLCGRSPDSGPHTLLECCRLKGRQIQRHDAAVRKILKALQRGSRQGNVYTILDACRADQLEELGADAKRVARWLVPQTSVSDEELLRMRPDIVRILELPGAPTEEQIAHATANKEQYTVQVVEVGYCSDLNWRSKMQEKMAQHQKLLQELKAAGWKVDEQPQVIVLGALGAVYLSGREALVRLGLTKAQASKLLAELSVMAVEAAYEITLMRRRLEGGCPTTRVGVG